MPLAIEHSGSKNALNWKVELAKVDYHWYLPLFFDGIREKEEPFRFIAIKGVEDMLKVCHSIICFAVHSSFLSFSRQQTLQSK